MYKLNEEKMFFDMADGQAVVINFRSGMYYGTDALGSAVLERLVHGAAPDRLAAEVKALPGCPGDFDAKLEGFIARLCEKEILIPGGMEAEDGAPIGEGALGDGFELPLDEFSEVQDLILADPVHDVDVEQGWPVIKED